MILGAITSSWGEHILTTDLPRLVARARNRGAEHIELRRSYMGQYEEGGGDDWRPAMDKLVRLIRTFPVLTFNLAIEYPWLTGEPDPASAQFQASVEAARALGAVGTPKLRVVDNTRFDSPWERAEEVSSVATGVAGLVRETARHGVRLVVKSTGQPIRGTALVVQEARKLLTTDETPYLGLCVDPILSMEADPGSDPVAEVQDLPLDYIAMFHFKQTRDGQLLHALDDGDLDYKRLLNVLKDKGYDDLAILEVPARDEAFEDLKEGIDYLGRLTNSG